MRNFYLILPIVLCLASCKSKQEVVLQPLPAEILTINEHYYNDDLDALIEDFKAYPQYRDYAYEVIFMDYDFSRMSYEDIFFLKENNANTPELQEGFKGVLEVYQLDITKQLSQMSIDSLYLYYMKHPVQRGFIGELLDSTIIKVMPELEYPEIKYLANLFDGTLVGEKMRQIQQEQKAKKTTILEDLDNFTLRETGSLDIFKKEIEVYALRSAFDNLETFMEKMMKDDFPKDKEEVTKLVNTLIRQTMSAEVEKYVRGRVLEYVDEINSVRKSCFISLSDDSIKALNSLNSEMLVDYNQLQIPRYRIRYNPDPLYVISKKQNRRDWLGGALTIISFAPIPFIDAIDLAYGVGSTIKVQNDIKKQNVNFLNDFAESIKKSSWEYSEKIANVINEELTKSQETFKTEVYEIY
ncbi:MAG: hypothetical protein IKJ92_00300 [Bacteroidaceae bacterium]|nr:hypothetical protein [Bacteroidaceae bacterium]